LSCTLFFRAVPAPHGANFWEGVRLPPEAEDTGWWDCFEEEVWFFRSPSAAPSPFLQAPTDVTHGKFVRKELHLSYSLSRAKASAIASLSSALPMPIPPASCPPRHRPLALQTSRGHVVTHSRRRRRNPKSVPYISLKRDMIFSSNSNPNKRGLEAVAELGSNG